MAKTVFVLTRYEEKEIVGIVDNEEYAKDWVGGNDMRDYDEFELNKVECEECKHDWKFDS